MCHLRLVEQLPQRQLLPPPLLQQQRLPQRRRQSLLLRRQPLQPQVLLLSPNRKEKYVYKIKTTDS